MDDASKNMTAKTAPDKETSVSLQNCRLTPIPDEVWQRLCRRSFCRRHPVITVLLALVVLVMTFTAGVVVSEDDDDVAQKPSLALVVIKGPIMDGSKVLAWIDRVAREKNIKGVLLRVNSPGGGAAASQELYAALKELAARKPLAVSMGSMAASGGLMVSMAGERIFANAGTVTGSIGVRMDIPQVHKLMEKVGVGSETLTTGPYKAAASATRPLTAEDRAYLEATMREVYDQFVGIVAEERKMSVEQVRALADGRIFSGRQARENGLVDEIGGMDRAKAWLCEKTGVDPDRELVRRPEEGRWLVRQISSMLGQGLAAGTESLRDWADEMETPILLYR